jgi:hypothetical protein
VALEGDLSLFRLPDVLQVIAHQRKTGILTVQGKSDILAVSFLDGEIVAGDALNQSFDELLGEVLARRGSLARERFAELALRQRGSGERLIDYLIESRAVGREEMLESLRDLTYRLMLEVLRWREGQFKFYGGEEVAYEEGIRPLRVEDVLMRALRELAGESGRTGAIPHGYLTYVPASEGRALRLIPAGTDESPLDPEVAWITPDEKAVLDRLDGRTAADALARNSGLGEERTFYALYRLLQAGLVRPQEDGDAAEPARRPPAPRPPARSEALRVERAAFEAADLAPHTPHPVAVALGRAARLLPLLLAAVLALILVRSPAPVLFPAPGSASERAAFERLRRLERFGVIDRAARTFHLLEGRYPVGLEELIARDLLPRRAAADPSGAELLLRSDADSYQIVLAAAPTGASGLREGVYGDFLLDRRLFEGLGEEGGVPLVLVD